mmetsp:Transcript_12767/g.45210  ORF Transcript_12767/g.45210 Transcript_12767/m.45210 type:complete len:278 (-) Transcript_12767:117-950(-)
MRLQRRRTARIFSCPWSNRCARCMAMPCSLQRANSSASASSRLCSSGYKQAMFISWPTSTRRLTGLLVPSRIRPRLPPQRLGLPHRGPYWGPSRSLQRRFFATASASSPSKAKMKSPRSLSLSSGGIPWLRLPRRFVAFDFDSRSVPLRGAAPTPGCLRARRIRWSRRRPCPDAAELCVRRTATRSRRSCQWSECSTQPWRRSCRRACRPATRWHTWTSPWWMPRLGRRGRSATYSDCAGAQICRSCTTACSISATRTSEGVWRCTFTFHACRTSRP